MNGPLRVERNANDGHPCLDHRLMQDSRFLALLSDTEADAIEAQLAGPDLTELRAAVRDYDDDAMYSWDVVAVARRLVDGTDGAE